MTNHTTTLRDMLCDADTTHRTGGNTLRTIYTVDELQAWHEQSEDEKLTMILNELHALTTNQQVAENIVNAWAAL